jgi:hypothetical protein
VQEIPVDVALKRWSFIVAVALPNSITLFACRGLSSIVVNGNFALMSESATFRR